MTGPDDSAPRPAEVEQATGNTAACCELISALTRAVVADSGIHHRCHTADEEKTASVASFIAVTGRIVVDVHAREIYRYSGDVHAATGATITT